MTNRSVTHALLVLLLAAAIAGAFVYRQDLNPSALETRMEDFGSWAPLVFVAAYALATVLFMPSSIFALAGLDGHLERPFAVMCFTDKKSKSALKLLKDPGFAEALLAEGGMKEWNRLGLPVERGNEVKS